MAILLLFLIFYVFIPGLGLVKPWQFLLGLAYGFRASVYYLHGEHDSMQADIVLEKELSGLHLDLQAAGRDLAWFGPLTPQCPSPVTHFLQQRHTS